jgi:hypothetical protein
MREPAAFGILYFAFGIAALEKAHRRARTANRELRADNSNSYRSIIRSTWPPTRNSTPATRSSPTLKVAKLAPQFLAILATFVWRASRADFIGHQRQPLATFTQPKPSASIMEDCQPRSRAHPLDPLERESVLLPAPGNPFPRPRRLRSAVASHVTSPAGASGPTRAMRISIYDFALGAAAPVPAWRANKNPARRVGRTGFCKAPLRRRRRQIADSDENIQVSTCRSFMARQASHISGLQQHTSRMCSKNTSGVWPITRRREHFKAIRGRVVAVPVRRDRT